jgi:hypothetical protein
MRRAFCKTWVLVVGITVVTSVAGCGGDGESASSVAAPSPSSPPVDVDVAYAQFLKAVKPFWCADGFSGIGGRTIVGAADTIKVVDDYRAVMMTWDDDLARIAVPPVAQPIVGKLRELNAAELADMDALTAAAENNERGQMKPITGILNLDDAMVNLETGHLSAALGHPEPQAGIAFNELEVTTHTFSKDIAPVAGMLDAALSRNDLDGATAANAVKQAAAQRFIDRLHDIDWPTGVESQVNVVRVDLRKVIDFARRQVDVATTAQIVYSEEGASLVPAVFYAVDSLQDSLNKLRTESAPELAC